MARAKSPDKRRVMAAPLPPPPRVRSEVECCGTETWRGRLCQWHDGYLSGWQSGWDERDKELEHYEELANAAEGDSPEQEVEGCPKS